MNASPATILSNPLVSSAHPNVVIDTIKPAEDGRGFVVRLYESSGSATRARLNFGVTVLGVHLSNTLEDVLAPLTFEPDGCGITLRPFQIATLRIESVVRG